MPHLSLSENDQTILETDSLLKRRRSHSTVTQGNRGYVPIRYSVRVIQYPQQFRGWVIPKQFCFSTTSDHVYVSNTKVTLFA